MKKVRITSIEIIGYLGIILWVAIILLREYNVSDHAGYQFLIGILPNAGAAWVATMFGKWVIDYIFKQKYTIKTHAVICACILALALGSEIVHDLFLNSPFDLYDILVTIIAQMIMLFVPILLKNKRFSGIAS